MNFRYPNMPIILTTPPSVEPLTLAEVKTHLRVTHGDDDIFISTLIASARRMIEQRYGLAVMQQSWSVFQDQWPEDGLFDLPLFPVQSITDLKTYGDDDVAATIDPAHYYLDAVSRPSRLVLRRGRTVQPPGRRVNGIEIKLVAGFTSTPQTIKQALLIVIGDWYANRGDVDAGDLPLSAKLLLTPYSVVRLT
jgi:uncharacterized phiE125 gp8 family phage protein